MTRPIHFLLPLAIALQISLGAGVAKANSIPILEVTGTNPPSEFCCTMQGSAISTDPEWLGLSFSLDRPFHDLTLSVPQIAFSNTFTGTAWLTTAIGSNATASDVVASSKFTNLTGSDVSYTFFNNLDLDRGTYYFLISSPHCDDTHPCPSAGGLGYGIGVWLGFQQATVQAVPGVTYDGSFTAVMALSQWAQCVGASFQGCNLNYDNPVASNWSPFYSPADLSFEIARTVPEPATQLLFGGGLMVMWLVTRRLTPMTRSVPRRS
jgi:PEP-CTERM motif